jgi:hypothetical protein
MRHKLFAAILALTVMSWAQTSTQTTPSQTPAAEKAKPSCCEKMANGSKDATSACMRHKDGKEMASCCAGKDGASCCGEKDAKACMKDGKCAADCCKEVSGTDKTASCCNRKAGKECGKGCCGSNKSEKPA